MKGNYQPLPRPVPFDKVLNQQADDKQLTGKNNAGEPLAMLSPAPARPAEEPPQNRRRRTRHAHATEPAPHHQTRTRPTRQQRLNTPNADCPV